jgi:hypothetical protein
MEQNGQAQVEQGAKDGGTEAPEQMADQTRLEGKSGGEADGQAKQGQHLERVLEPGIDIWNKNISLDGTLGKVKALDGETIFLIILLI